MSRERDPYTLLGVNRQASASDISRAYRRAARETHPDSRPEEPGAAGRFNDVTEAYETLRDPARRAAYDRAHPGIERVDTPYAYPVSRPPTVELAALSRRRRMATRVIIIHLGP